MTYDAVIVGAGPNGLAAGISLARSGKSVLVMMLAFHWGGSKAGVRKKVSQDQIDVIRQKEAQRRLA